MRNVAIGASVPAGLHRAGLRHLRKRGRYPPGTVTDPAYLPGLGPDDEPVAVAEPQPFVVEVTRSAKRRKTVGAQLVGGVLRIALPSWMSKAEEAHWVREMSGRFQRKMSADRLRLDERSAALSRRYDLPKPGTIRWADDMRSRWGSCTPSQGTIRISNRLAAFPDWVIDYVIVHELAHLEVLGHNDDFWRLVYRYPKAERAIGYLIAKSGDGDEVD
jgi:predicted metal-dependent hydrolase